MRGKAHCLLHSYLCDRSLFVVARGDSSRSQQEFLRVEFGLSYCLICISVIFQLRFCIVNYFGMLIIQLS